MSDNEYVSYTKWCEKVVVRYDILIKTKQLDGKRFENGEIGFTVLNKTVDYNGFISALEHVYRLDNRNMKTYKKHLLKTVNVVEKGD